MTLTAGGNNTTTTYSGVASDGSGQVALTKSGTGTLTLSGVNTYTGATSITAGTLSIAADTALGTPPGAPVANQLVFNGGTLLATASFTLDPDRGITLTGAGTLNVNAGLTLSYAGVISGAGALTKSGTGTLTLSGVNTYTGATSITAGTLSIAADTALGTPPGAPVANQLVFNGGTLLATASFTLDPDRGITLTGAGTLNVNAGLTLSYAGVITGAGALTKSGTGTLTLSGVNTYTGVTTLSAGDIRVQSSAALGATSGAATVATGTAIELDGSGLSIGETITSIIGTGIGGTGALRNLANSNTWTGLLTMGAGGTTVDSDAGTLTLSGGFAGNTRPLTVQGAGDTVISGAIVTTTGTLTKNGAGKLTLGAVNSYTGATSISTGTLALGIANAIGASSAVTVSAGATFDLAGFSDTVGSLAGAGSLTSTAAGGVTLTAGGNNTTTTYSGVASDGSGQVALTKSGTGTLTLSGVNTYTGATSITAGSLSIAADTALGTPPGAPVANQLVFNGGTLLATASFTLDPDRGITLTGAGTLNVNAGLTLSYAGVISGAGALTKSGTGTLTLSGVNTYTGATSITAGSLSIAADTALGTPPGAPVANQLVFNGGTLLATASFTLDPDRGITLTGAGTLNVNAGLTLSYAGVISGAGALTKSGTGTLTLSGVNTYTGATSITAGSLSIAADTALGTPPGAPVANQLVFNGGTLLATASFTLDPDRGITLTGAGTLNVNAGLTLSYAGVISGAGALTKSGTGTLTLSGVNTYTGATSITAGSLSIAADTALGTPPGAPVANQLVFNGGTLLATASFTLDPDRGITLTGAGTLNVNAGLTLSYAGVISGAGALTKSGTGTLDFGGASGTTGGIEIDAGSLLGPGSGTFNVSGDWLNYADTSAFTPGGATISLNGSGAHTLGGTFPTTFSALRIADAGGIGLGTDVVVTGTLTFTSGVIATGSNTVIVATGGTVSRTSGYVNGNLSKNVPIGAPTVTFEVGDASAYSPVTLAFGTVTVAGDLTVSATGSDHPQIGSSTLDASLSVNRYWTLSGPSVGFDQYDATFTFVASDKDPGVNTNRLVVESYASSTWSSLATGARSATSTQALSVTAFGDFAIGELAGSALDHFVVTAPASSNAGSHFDLTVTAMDPVGNVVTGYLGTITISSTDAYAVLPGPYTFITGDHGSQTFNNGVKLAAAGSQTISVADGPYTGTSSAIVVSAGAFSQLLVVLPGETSAPGAPTGRVGTPANQQAHTSFTITVLSVDAWWNPVAATDTVAITSSDPLAVPPAEFGPGRRVPDLLRDARDTGNRDGDGDRHHRWQQDRQHQQHDHGHEHRAERSGRRLHGHPGQLHQHCGPWRPVERHGCRVPGPECRHSSARERPSARVTHAERRRIVQLHAGCRLQRQRLVHVRGNRRVPGVSRGNGHAQRATHRVCPVLALVQRLRSEPFADTHVPRLRAFRRERVWRDVHAHLSIERWRRNHLLLLRDVPEQHAPRHPRQPRLARLVRRRKLGHRQHLPAGGRLGGKGKPPDHRVVR